MSAPIKCPVCDWTHTYPELPEVNAAFADILGTTPLGMHEVWRHQQRVEGERLTEQHLRSHSVLEWITAIRERDDMILSLTASFAQVSR